MSGIDPIVLECFRGIRDLITPDHEPNRDVGQEARDAIDV
jgi:hypothetical protein